MGTIKRVPVLNTQVNKALEAEVDKSVQMFYKKKIDVPDRFVIPATGINFLSSKKKNKQLKYNIVKKKRLSSKNK